MRRLLLAVDPGGTSTGVCLLDVTGAPVPVDAFTLERDKKGDESDAKHMGTPTYTRRVMACIDELLVKHAVQDDELMVAVETFVIPGSQKKGRAKGLGLLAVWRHSAGLLSTLGAVSTRWADAVLVAPDAHDHKPVPDVLRGRRPAEWSESSSQRQHQRAAWHVGLAALKITGGWVATPQPRRTAEPVFNPEVDPVAPVVAAVRRSGDLSIKAVVRATKELLPKASPETVAQIAARAAVLLDPALDAADVQKQLLERLTRSSAA